MSFCPNCGKQLDGNPLFCPECGTYLMNAEKQETAPQAAAFQQNEQPQQPVQPQAQPVQQTPYQPPVQQPVQSAPTYNTLPQQQPNAYSGYTSAAPVEKPDKVSVGLVILSFVFPLIGLIIYFVKRKKQPKNAKAILTAAAISVLIGGLMTWFGSKDGDVKETVSKAASDVTVEWEPDEDTTEAPEPSVAYGSFDTKKYTNDYFGISYTLPENFAFESYSELADTVGTSIDSESGIPVLNKSTVKMYYDSAAFSSTTGSSIMTIVVPSDGLTELADMEASELLESVVEGATQSYDNAQKTDLYPLTIAGQKCDAINVGFESEGVKFTATYFALEKNNSYFIAQVITSNYDDNTPQTYLANFE